MEQISNIEIGRDITGLDLNNLNRSYHEGIYIFNKEDCIIRNNYPAENKAGFLIIHTDFDDSLVIQKITTFDNSFYFRTGNKDGANFNWSSWDRYATIEDIPAKNMQELEDTYINNSAFYPMSNIASINSNIDNFTITSQELNNIVTETYRFLGMYSDEDLVNLDDQFPYTYTLDNDTTTSHRNFLLGYWIKDNHTNLSEEELKNKNQPSNKPGILQAYSSILNLNQEEYEGKVHSDSFRESGERGSVVTTWIFNEFESGSIYITQTKNKFYFNPNDPDDDKRKWKWTKYSFDSTETYNLNMRSGEHQKKLNDILDLSKNIYIREKDKFRYSATPGKTYDRLDDDGNTIVAVWDTNNSTSNIRIKSVDTSVTENPKNHTVISWLYPSGHSYHQIIDEVAFGRSGRRPEIEDLPDVPDTRSGYSFSQIIFNSFQLWYGRNTISRKEE